MKILATSDLHGNLGGLNLPEDCEVAIIAGDFAKLNGFGKWHLNDQKKWIQKKFIPWTQKYQTVQFLVVPGNHDMVCDSSTHHLFPDVNFRIKYPKNVHLLVNSGIEINGKKFYGSPNIPIISYRWAFESEHDKLKEVFSKIPENLDVLITHTPPHIPDFDLDRSLQFGDNRAFGSNELTEAILEKKPKYVFCGHIHTGTHGGVLFENTTRIYNVSRVDERYEIAFEPEIMEV